jgi:hypothetical protein
VFVDDTGRRAHGVHLAGAAIAMLCACWLATLVFGMSGFTSLPGPPASVMARVLPPRGPIADIEPVLGAKLRWAGDTQGTNSARPVDRSYGSGLRE